MSNLTHFIENIGFKMLIANLHASLVMFTKACVAFVLRHALHPKTKIHYFSVSFFYITRFSKDTFFESKQYSVS